MGYGFPGAIGAQIGNPDTPVISITGDGGMQMNIQEFATAVLEELPLIICVFNNTYLGMVRQWQKLFYGKRYSMTNLRSGALSWRTDGEGIPEIYAGFRQSWRKATARKDPRHGKRGDRGGFPGSEKQTKKGPTLDRIHAGSGGYWSIRWSSRTELWKI